MENFPILNVAFRGEIVGTFADYVPDMAYLEGKFVPANTSAGAEFNRVAQALDPRTAFENCQGLDVVIQESPDAPGLLFVVMSLSEGSLFGRRMGIEPRTQTRRLNQTDPRCL